MQMRKHYLQVRVKSKAKEIRQRQEDFEKQKEKRRRLEEHIKTVGKFRRILKGIENNYVTLKRN